MPAIPVDARDRELALVLLDGRPMRVYRLPCILLSLSSAWIACTDDPRPDDPGNVEPTPIHVTASQSPALVAFRDGFTAQWQAATAGVTVDFAVHGPYELAVVCQSATAWQVWQYARTPDDETQLVVPCGV